MLCVALLALAHWAHRGATLLSLSVLAAMVTLCFWPPVCDVGKQTFGRFVVRHSAEYFPLDIHVEDEAAFDAGTKYIFACEPHCFLPLGVFALCDLVGALPRSMRGPADGVRILGSSAVLHLPLLRQIVYWVGFRSVDKASFRKELAMGHSCALVPGGAYEVVHQMICGSALEAARVMLRRRLGFVRLAIEADAQVVPVALYGGEDLYDMEQRFCRMTLVKKLTTAMRFAPVFFWGRPVFGVGFMCPVPRQKPLRIVIGKPLKCDKGLEGSHAALVEAWDATYERHREAPAEQ